MSTPRARSLTFTLALTVLGGALAASGCKKSEPNKPTTSGAVQGAPGAPPAPGQKLPPAAPTKRSPDDYGSYACRLMKGCYTKHQAFGQVAGRITINVGADGKATASAYDNGTAPGPVKDCIVTSGKMINIPGFDAGAGQLVCDYNGQLMAGGMEIMTKSWKFVPGAGAK